MSGSDNSLWMQAPELANARRRAAFGQALLQQGSDSSPIRHPLQGLARLAAALVGGAQVGQSDRDVAEYNQRNEQELQDFYRSMPTFGGGQPGAQPAALPPAQQGAQGPVSPDEDMAVRTVWGEARGEPPEGQQAVYAVMRNRARMSGKSIRDVALEPGQFEPWGNPQTRAKLEALDANSPEYQTILANLRANQNDPTGGATHFYSPGAQAQLGRQAPAWATGDGRDIGAHRFYALPYGGQQPEATPVAAPGAPAGPAQSLGFDPASASMSYANLAQRAAMSRNPLIQRMAPVLMHQAQMMERFALARQPQGTEAERLAVAAGLKPGTPEYQAAMRAALERKGGPQNVIEMKGESAYEQARGKDLSERARGWEEAGVKATRSLATLSQMERAIDQFQTGIGSETQIKAGQIAQKLGVPMATLEALGWGPDKIAKGEEIRALAGQLLIGQLGSGGFPSNNFSNTDRDFLTGMLPGLLNTPAGNKIILGVRKAEAMRDLEINRAWRDWTRTNGESLDSVRKFQAEVLPTITERDIIVPQMRQNGWIEVPQAGPGGGGGQMPTVNSPEEAEKLPPGTQFLMPNGKVGTVPARPQ